MCSQVFSTCEYENIVYIRKSCDAEKIDPMMLMDVCIVTPPEYKKVCFWNAVFLYICMYVPLTCA
jgi:hypothetical protein